MPRKKKEAPVTAAPPPPEPNAQLSLLPAEDIDITSEEVLLDDLPPDESLSGEPSPQLIDSIKGAGRIAVPIIVIRRSDGEEVVADGRRRVKAARLLNFATLPAQVWHTDSSVQHVLTIITNYVRTTNEASEFEAYRELQQAGITDDRVVEITGIDKAKLKKLTALTRLHPTLFSALRHAKISFSLARAIASMPKEAQAGLAAIYDKEGKLKAGVVAGLKEQLANALPKQEALEIAPEPTVEAPAAPEQDDDTAFYRQLGEWLYAEITDHYSKLGEVESLDLDYERGRATVIFQENQQRTIKLTIEEVGAVSKETSTTDESQPLPEPTPEYDPVAGEWPANQTVNQ